MRQRQWPKNTLPSRKTLSPGTFCCISWPTDRGPMGSYRAPSWRGRWADRGSSGEGCRFDRQLGRCIREQVRMRAQTYDCHDMLYDTIYDCDDSLQRSLSRCSIRTSSSPCHTRSETLRSLGVFLSRTMDRAGCYCELLRWDRSGQVGRTQTKKPGHISLLHGVTPETNPRSSDPEWKPTHVKS